jgi:hypothetical protein
MPAGGSDPRPTERPAQARGTRRLQLDGCTSGEVVLHRLLETRQSLKANGGLDRLRARAEPLLETEHLDAVMGFLRLA